MRFTLLPPTMVPIAAPGWTLLMDSRGVSTITLFLLYHFGTSTINVYPAYPTLNIGMWMRGAEGQLGGRERGSLLSPILISLCFRRLFLLS